MRSTATECTPHLMEAFLRSELSLADEDKLTSHIETCEPCRQRLEFLAANEESWTDAKTYLQPTAFDKPNAALSSRKRKPSIQVSSVLDSLAATDDPEMLGRLAGYEISGVVGVGGMGIVLKAFDRSLDRTVAIKVLAPHLATSGAARSRFAREAKAAAAVLHPNVIAIHSVSNDETLPWLVMPYIRGQSLQKRIDREGALPVSEILRIGSQIASGLASAHAQGLVHRDIKPANVLLEEGVERVTITDFGLARAMDDATMTRSGIIAGTPQFMSPEQARGEAVDGRSDLFSLGSVLYTMCTGHSPFRAETTYGVMRRITDEPARDIRESNPEIPAWLGLLIDNLMAKQPEDRFQSSFQVAEILEECLAHVQQPNAIELPTICSQLEQSSRLKNKPARNKKSNNETIRSRRSFVFWITVVAAFFGVMGGFAGMWWQASDPPDISGTWNSDEWGQVTLQQVSNGKYEGEYTDTYGEQPGSINLKWSRLEKRFNGKWRDGERRFGKISIRMVEDELRGAWTTNKKVDINPGNPRLADLAWTRSSDSTDASEMAGSSDRSHTNPESASEQTSSISKRIDGRVESISDEYILVNLESDNSLRIGESIQIIRENQMIGIAELTNVVTNKAVAKLTWTVGLPMIKKGDRVARLFGSPNSEAPVGLKHITFWVDGNSEYDFQLDESVNIYGADSETETPRWLYQDARFNGRALVQDDKLLVNVYVDEKAAAKLKSRIDNFEIVNLLAPSSPEARKIASKSSVIPRGMKVVGVSLAEDDHLADLILRGDLVDVVQAKFGTDGSRVYQTVLHNLRVFSIETSKGSKMTIVGLLVDSTKAGILINASQDKSSTIRIALKNDSSTSPGNGDSSPVTQLGSMKRYSIRVPTNQDSTSFKSGDRVDVELTKINPENNSDEIKITLSRLLIESVATASQQQGEQVATFTSVTVLITPAAEVRLQEVDENTRINLIPRNE